MGLRTTLVTVALTALALRKFEQFHQQGNGVHRPSSFTRSHKPGAGFSTGYGSSAFGVSNNAQRVRRLGGGLGELARAAFSLFDRGIDGLMRHTVQPNGSRYAEGRFRPTHYDQRFSEDNGYRFSTRSDTTQSTQTDAADHARASAPSRFDTSTTTDGVTGDGVLEPSRRSAFRSENTNRTRKTIHVQFEDSGGDGDTSRYGYHYQSVGIVPEGNGPAQYELVRSGRTRMGRTLIEHHKQPLGSRSSNSSDDIDIPVRITNNGGAWTTSDASFSNDLKHAHLEQRNSLPFTRTASPDEPVSETASRNFGEFAERMSKRR